MEAAVDGVPGMFTSIAGMDPAVWHEMNTAVIRMTAGNGSMKRMNDKNRVRMLVSFRPGIAPARSPTTAPITTNSIVFRVKSC